MVAVPGHGGAAGTTTGTTLNGGAYVVFPCWPQVLSPHAHTPLVASRARLCNAPAAIAFALIPIASTGTALCASAWLSPSCPELLSPQVQTSPVLARTMAWI